MNETKIRFAVGFAAGLILFTPAAAILLSLLCDLLT